MTEALQTNEIKNVIAVGTNSIFYASKLVICLLLLIKRESKEWTQKVIPFLLLRALIKIMALQLIYILMLIMNLIIFLQNQLQSYLNTG